MVGGTSARVIVLGSGWGARGAALVLLKIIC
jgi:hypothetical protein